MPMIEEGLNRVFTAREVDLITHGNALRVMRITSRIKRQAALRPCGFKTASMRAGPLENPEKEKKRMDISRQYPILRRFRA